MNVSRKLFCLFMGLSSSRVNTISKLKITNMCLADDEYIFVFNELLKYWRPLNCRVFSGNRKNVSSYYTEPVFKHHIILFI